MENERYYFRVGVFVTVVITVAFFVFMWFAVGSRKQDYITYAIYFNQSVSGINVGSPVTFKGINVGSVEDISFQSFHNDTIRVLVDIIDTAPIRTDTVAYIKLQGITGTSVIFLENTGDNSAPLMQGEDDEYRVIHATQSHLDRVVTNIPELLEQLTMLTGQIQSLFSNPNIAKMGVILNELEQGSKGFSRLLGYKSQQSVHSTLEETRHVLIEAKKAMREIKMLAKTLRDDPSQIIRAPKYEGYKVP